MPTRCWEASFAGRWPKRAGAKPGRRAVDPHVGSTASAGMTSWPPARSARRMLGGRGGFAVLLLGLAGCGGSGPSMHVTVPPERQTRLEPGAALQLRVPAAMPFNQTDSARESKGDGRADSRASTDGTAFAEVSVGTNGTASAVFQVGHVLFSTSAEAVDAVVAFDCRFLYEMRCADSLKNVPQLIELLLVVEDAEQHKLHELILVSQEDRYGAARREGREAPSFNLRMEPGIAYVLRATGSVSATAEKDATPVEARLELQEFAIEIRAPAAQGSAAANPS